MPTMLPAGWNSGLARYELDLKTGKGTIEWLKDKVEMPVVSPMRASRPSRYLYTVQVADVGEGV